MLYLYSDPYHVVGPFEGPQGPHADGAPRQITIFISLTFIPKIPCAQILISRSSRLDPPGLPVYVNFKRGPNNTFRTSVKV